MMSIIGHANNIHCLATAVNSIAGALFTLCGQGDVEERLKEFLAVSMQSYKDMIMAGAASL